jgi:hypothetical protein
MFMRMTTAKNIKTTLSKTDDAKEFLTNVAELLTNPLQEH